MRWRVLFWSVWLLLAFAFSVRFIFADGEPCYDCQNCWQNIINCATNGGNCSSNCVKFSPSDCSNFVNGVLAEIETITGSVNVIIGNVDAFIEFIDDTLIPSVNDSLGLVSSALFSLDNYSSSNSAALSAAASFLEYAVSRISTFSNTWSAVDGTGGRLWVSNNISGVTGSFVHSAKIGQLARQVVPRLNSSISILSDLDDYSINEIANVRSDLQVAYSVLLDVQDYLKVYPYLLSTAKDNANTVLSSSLQLRSYVDSVNCEPCGRGGGSGGSGGGTVDFTGVSAQLDDIKTLLQQVYDLIYNYYTDYNSARSRSSVPSGSPSYEGYVSLGDNWFKRVEYLLYSSSPVASNNLEGTESPDTIEGQTAFESETTQLEESVDTITGGFDQSLSRPWAKFAEHFSQFWDRLNAFVLPGQSSGQLGQLEWSHLDILSYSKDGNGFTLQAQSDLDGFSSVWYKFAVGFRVLWFLLVLTLYCLFFIFMIKYSFKVAAFVTKLLNTSFGSG